MCCVLSKVFSGLFARALSETISLKNSSVPGTLLSRSHLLLKWHDRNTIEVLRQKTKMLKDPLPPILSISGDFSQFLGDTFPCLPLWTCRTQNCWVSRWVATSLRMFTNTYTGKPSVRFVSRQQAPWLPAPFIPLHAIGWCCAMNDSRAASFVCPIKAE